MERANGEPSSTAAASLRTPAGSLYEPPQVAWEEEFEPLAASCPDLDPECQPDGSRAFRP